MQQERENFAIQCRMYPNDFPSVGEIVMVKIEKIDDTSIFVSLLEYDALEGMIVMSEVSRKKMKNVHRLLKINQIEPMIIIRLNEQQRYIDLSRKQLSINEIEQAMEKWRKTKFVYSIFQNLALTYSLPVLEIYTRIGWPLLKETHQEHLYDVIQSIHTDPTFFLHIDIQPQEQEKLLNIIDLKLKNDRVLYSIDIEMTFFGKEGIHGIKKIVEKITKDKDITIKLIAPPHYRIYGYSKEILEQTSQVLEHELEEAGGNMKKLILEGK